MAWTVVSKRCTGRNARTTQWLGQSCPSTARAGMPVLRGSVGVLADDTWT
ncbi:MAG: hypothetical protein NZ874_06325 [Fimbriimonadales bacterium]|nr:hypothetical protein [Fimbriimonadales bacterium]